MAEISYIEVKACESFTKLTKIGKIYKISTPMCT